MSTHRVRECLRVLGVPRGVGGDELVLAHRLTAHLPHAGDVVIAHRHLRERGGALVHRRDEGAEQRPARVVLAGCAEVEGRRDAVGDLDEDVVRRVVDDVDAAPSRAREGITNVDGAVRLDAPRQLGEG